MIPSSTPNSGYLDPCYTADMGFDRPHLVAANFSHREAICQTPLIDIFQAGQFRLFCRHNYLTANIMGNAMLLT